jgi:hypothetical protein
MVIKPTNVVVTPLRDFKGFENASPTSYRVNVKNIPENLNNFLFQKNKTSTRPNIGTYVPKAKGGKNSTRRSRYRKKSTRRHTRRNRHRHRQ